MCFRAKFFLQNLLALFQIIFWKYFQTPLDLWGHPPCPRGRIPMRERCPGGSGNSLDYYWYHFQQVLLKELCSKMRSWACPCQVPTPGAEWTPPRCPGGSGNSLDYYWYHFQQVLLKELCSKMHSWAYSCRGPTPGAGWTPPSCPGRSGNSPDYYLYHF